MTVKSAKFIAAAAILAALAMPAHLDRTHLLSSSAAWAGNGHGGGNGGGGGNGNAGGNGNGNAGANSNAGGNANTHPDNNGAIASSLGALNAAHASATAFANNATNPNSRLGKIAAYKTASDALVSAQNELAADAAIPGFGPGSLVVDPLGKTYDQLAAEIALDQQATTAALNAAANKTPVSADTQAALDGLLDGKVTP